MRKLVYAVVALSPVIALFLNDLAWAFRLSGTYETRIEHVGSIPSIRRSGSQHAQGPSVPSRPVSLPVVDSGFFHSSHISLRPKLEYRWFSLAGEYVIRASERPPGLALPPAPAFDSYPDLPPFESYYQWNQNPATDTRLLSGRWERFWGTVHFSHFDISAGTKSTPFGVAATLGSDVTNDIIALHWSIRNFHFTAGTGLWVPETSTDHFSVLPPAPWNALRMNGLFAGSYLDLPERKTEQRCKKRLKLCGCCKKKAKSFGWLDTIVLVFKVVGWLAGTGKSSEEEKDSEDSKQSDYVFSQEGETRPCWTRYDYECEPEYEYYDCHDVVVYEPTPEEIRAARVHGLTRFYEDRMDVHKPFKVLLVRGDFPYFSAGMGNVWFPVLRRRLPGGSPTLNPSHEVDNARLWLTFLHYRDKRYFAKAEYSTLAWNTHPDALSHRERIGYHFFAEVGTHRGPIKVSLMAALASGFDREEMDHCIHFPINDQALAPYESLMFHRYGGGNLAYHGSPEEGKGMLSDGFAVGGRLDYSAATNLNLWTSALWAHRLGNSGAQFGQFAPSGLPATEDQRRLFAHAAGRSMHQAPNDYGYVSDGALGYEFNVGADWKPIPDLNVALQAALWQPGAWFKEAHQGLGLVYPGYGLTPSPIETRSAIYGLSASVAMEF